MTWPAALPAFVSCLEVLHPDGYAGGGSLRVRLIWPGLLDTQEKCTIHFQREYQPRRRLAMEWVAQGKATMSAVTASLPDIVDTAPGAWILIEHF